MDVLAIDPSVNGTGVALFRNGRLTDTSLLYCLLKTQVSNFGEIARQVARNLDLCFRKVDVLACEVPQIYKKSPGDPNDLIAVAMVAGAIIAEVLPTKIATCWPAEWKGQVPKQVHQPRILKKLDVAETAVMNQAKKRYGARFHNVVDAVGIGLWYLKKAEIRA